MPYPALRCVSMRQENTQTSSLGVWEESRTCDGGRKVTKERITDAEEAKVTEKKRQNNCQMQTKTRLTKKEIRKKPCTVAMDTSHSAFLRQLENLTSGKDGGTGEGGVLVTQEMMSDADAAKVDVKEKSVAPNPSDASDASDASKINTPKIDAKRGIG